MSGKSDPVALAGLTVEYDSTNTKTVFKQQGREVFGARLDGTVEIAGKRIARNMSLGKELYEDFEAYDTADQYAQIQPDGTAADGTADVLNHLYTPVGNIFCFEAYGDGATLFPAPAASGLDIGGDQTANDGFEIFSHFLGASGRPFVVGYDAAFYFACTFQIADVSGVDDLQVGFRRAEICRPGFDDYLDAAAMGTPGGGGNDPLAIYLQTINDNGNTTETDTTDTLADATETTWKILVSAAGAVTYTIDGAAPTTTAAFSFDDGDPVIPFFRFLHDTALGGAVTLMQWDVGYQ